MSGVHAREQPFYFGLDGELFGLFHAAGYAPGKAVLLCPPLGQDLIRCHRLYRQLAHALVAQGIPVLRFDYYGSGDSAGASEETDWDRCIADTAAAAAELRRRSGSERVVAFGARLGGSIALSAIDAARLAGVVAWDPVLDGGAFVARLDAMQDSLRVDTGRFITPRSAEEAAAQWLGFRRSERFRQQLSMLRIEPSTAPVLLLDSTGGNVARSWLDRPDVTVRQLQPSTPWDDLGRLEVAILSHPLIQTVTEHLREAA